MLGGPLNMSATRRQFLASTAAAAAFGQTRRPNVVLIISDDQGYGDLSIHGNPHLKTPHIDSIGTSGVQFTQFHVNPVCSPTRSSLMTGRDYYRTGVVDTYLGRSMMYPDETTVAELLAGAGYRTGIFGKWHLGDNYPMRAMDQGFQETLVHRGGGIGQPSDPPGGSSYFDPVLFENGKQVHASGYCTDVFFNRAIDFIERRRSQPFFAYIATNAPHSPLQVAGEEVKPFLGKGLDDTTTKIYGMVSNLDRNVGRLLDRIRALGIEQDTILIFMTDNGPQQRRYNAGMRGLKGSVYQGGIRVPFFLRWPGGVKGARKIGRLSAHIDVLPTLLDACGVMKPQQLAVDGRSLMPLLKDDRSAWPDRTLYFQWHRGDVPEPHRSAAARNQRYKLVNGSELYDLEADPQEQTDLSIRHPDIVARMRADYDEWFASVRRTRNFEPPRIHVGSTHENPVVLTRQDWRGARAGWTEDSLGHWEIDVVGRGNHSVTVHTVPLPEAASIRLEINGAAWNHKVEKGAAESRISPIPLPTGPGRLQATIQSGQRTIGPQYLEVLKL